MGGTFFRFPSEPARVYENSSSACLELSPWIGSRRRAPRAMPIDPVKYWFAIVFDEGIGSVSQQFHDATRVI